LRGLINRKGGNMSIATITEYLNKLRDISTDAVNTVEYGHHETHSGSRFYVLYSVASLGAMGSPDDMITLTFKTPDTTKWGHFVFTAYGSSGVRVRLIEGPTGGAASATGTLNILNKNRNYNISKKSTFTNGTTASVVNYDATLATGGTTLWDDYIPGSTNGLVGSGTSGKRDELVLLQNTTYQLSAYGTATEPATLYIDWYEHTNR